MLIRRLYLSLRAGTKSCGSSFEIQLFYNLMASLEFETSSRCFHTSGNGIENVNQGGRCIGISYWKIRLFQN